MVAIFALGCEEIYVIGHRDCGMSQIDEGILKQRMIERGVSPEAIEALQPGLKEWLGAFHDPYGNVRRVVNIVRRNGLIPGDVPVHGLMFDPHSGGLELLCDGYTDLQV